MPAELVKVPFFVAEWIDFCKSRGYSLYNAMHPLHEPQYTGYDLFHRWITDEDYGKTNEWTFIDAWRDGCEVGNNEWSVEAGDLVIRRGKYEAKVYFVEAIGETDVLLVNGYQDVYFSEEEGTLDTFYTTFRLLAHKDNLLKEEEE